MNKDVKKILIMLVFYSLSAGMLYNFQELWMTTNNLTVKTISVVYSLCALLTVSTIFICSNILKQNKLKGFLSILIYIKVLLILSLSILNSSGLNILIKLLIMIDYIIDVEILISIYPLITIITKDDKVFAKKGIIYTLFYYTGAIITAILLGKVVAGIELTYNFYLLLSALSLLVSFIILRSVDINKYLVNNKKEIDEDIMHKLVSKLKKDKISLNYLLYVFNGNISYYAINSLVLTLLINNLSITPSNASFLLLGLGILASFIALLILSKLTLKNNYINIGIKFLGRLFTYLLVIIFNSKITILISIIYTRILSESYSHITDAPYVNRFDSDLQLTFCNLKEMVGYLSRSIGTLICGIAITVNIRFAYLIALIFIIVQIIFAYRALYLRNKVGVK